MAAIEVVLKPITSKEAIRSLKEALSKSSVDKEAIEQAREKLKMVYGFNPK